MTIDSKCGQINSRCRRERIPTVKSETIRLHSPGVFYQVFTITAVIFSDHNLIMDNGQPTMSWECRVLTHSFINI